MTSADAGVSAEAGPTVADEVVIRAEGLSKTFGTVEAVRELDLEIHRGEIFGFLGPNGAGKSTTIRMLVGLMVPSAGSCRVLDCELPEQAERLRAKVGYMTQRFSLYSDLTVEENLDFAAEIFGIRRSRRRVRVAEMMDEYELGPRRRQLPSQLSGGWRQRLALATATIHEPELLVLDEPTAGVDPDSRRIFWGKLFELTDGGTTILVSTHYMDEAVRCHRLGVIRDGRRVALATPTEFVDAIEPRVLEFSGRPGQSAQRTQEIVRTLQADPAVASVIQLGHRAHVLLCAQTVDRAADAEQIVTRLAAAGLEIDGGPAEAHLEDALIALSRGEKLEIDGESNATRAASPREDDSELVDAVDVTNDTDQRQ